MITAALHYFATIFALGFALGAIRTLWLAPKIGATAAVLCELPLMMLASWWLAIRIVRAHALAPSTALGMGVLAFVLLMVAEALLAMVGFGLRPAQWAGDLVRTPGWIGLAGQIAFGLFPWLATIRTNSTR